MVYIRKDDTIDCICIKRGMIRWSTSAKDDIVDSICIKRGMIRWLTSNTAFA
jgi:hypothetical protein